MADLAAALTALQSLQSDDVSISADGNTARVVVEYLDTSPTGSRTQEKASYEFTVDFDPDSGEYKLSSAQRDTRVGPTGAEASIRKNPGTTKSYSFTKQVGPGGSVTSSFSSKPWEDKIRESVEAAGWTRRKGLMGKIFGR